MISPIAATNVPEVIVSTLMTIPREGRARRNTTPSSKLAIGTHLRIALYIGIFIPFKAKRAITVFTAKKKDKTMHDFPCSQV